MQFTTRDGCDITITKTPEGDLLMGMRVEHGGKGLATATVANAPDGSKVILGTHASVKLDAESRAALRAALETFEDWETHPDLPDEYYPPEAR